MLSKTSTEDRGLAKAVEAQLRRWEAGRLQPRTTTTAWREQVAHFVALSNQVGAGGDEIAATIATHLGWPVFDKQLLQVMAGDDAIRQRLYKAMDVRDLGWFEEVFRALLHQEFRKGDPFHRLAEVVLCVARKGHAIFLGRATDMMLPRSRGLRVKLIASHQRRAENVARRTGVSIEHAGREIDRVELERQDFIRRHFGTEADDPTRFDLLINVEHFSSDQIVSLIDSVVQTKMRSNP